MTRIVPVLLACLAGVAAAQDDSTWNATPIPPAPMGISLCGGMTGVGNGQDLYVLPGGNSKAFYRLTLGQGWTQLRDCPVAIGGLGPVQPSGARAKPNQVSICHAGGDFIYAATGTYGPTKGLGRFMRYSISTGLWTEDPAELTQPRGIIGGPVFGFNGLVSVAPGSVIARTKVGDGDAWMQRYDAAANEWTFLSDSPPTDDFGTAAYPGSGDAIYWQQGNTLMIYSIVRNQWNVTADGFPWEPRPMPLPRSDGYDGPIACPTGDRVCVLYSSGLNVYDISRDAWTPVELPGPAGDGNLDTFLDGISLAAIGPSADLYALPAGGSTACWSYGPPNHRPTVPSQLAQLRLNGLTPIETTTIETSFIVSGRIDDVDFENVRMDFRIRPVGTDFTGDAADRSTPTVASGSTVTIRHDGLALGVSYHWQVRTIDARDLKSDWVTFPGEIRTRLNEAPVVTAALQRRALGGAELPVGARILPEESVILEALVNDSDSDDITFEVEVAVNGAAFQGRPTAATGLGAAGRRVGVELRMPEGRCEWRCRALDRFGVASDWQAYAGSGMDVEVLSEGSVNVSGCPMTAAGAAGRLALVVVMLAGFLGTSVASRSR